MEPVTITFQRDPVWEFIEPIVPAYQAMPNWYKDAKAAITELPVYDSSRLTFKACPAIMDGFSQGYILPLWADVWVEPKEGSDDPSFWWDRRLQESAEDRKVVTPHNPWQTQDLKPFKDMSSSSIAWKLNSPWLVETPKDYSMLMIPPLNNRDSRFEPVAGVICTDDFTTYINVPLIWKAPPGYSGLIKKGTPLLQMIPFKRENFQHELGLTSDDGKRLLQKHDACFRGIASHFQNGYKKLFHKSSASK